MLELRASPGNRGSDTRMSHASWDAFVVRLAHQSPCGPSLRQSHHCLQGVQSYARAALHTIVDFSKVFECSAAGGYDCTFIVVYIIIP